MVDLEASLATMRAALISRGARSFSGLQRTFRLMDSYDGNKKVDRQEFETSLSEFNIPLNAEEMRACFDFFDKDGDNNINIDEFVAGMRPNLPESRQPVVDAAFAKFDKDGSGYIEVGDIKSEYDASYHPKVQSGEMQPDEVFAEFLQNFNDHDQDGRISKDEWNVYYASQSANIDNDEHFIQLITTAWQLES